MPLSLDQVKRIAYLARIEVSEDQARTTQRQLNDIFELIEAMQSVDTAGVDPMAHPQDLTLRLREDRVTEGDRHRDFQSAAPAVEGGLYLVPKVIE